jgi:choline dehydrogenase-like flavoprotein
MAGVDNRQVKLSRGRFLGGSSGCNGTLCIRGNKQDYDDWGLEGWSGEEFFEAMRKVSCINREPRQILIEAVGDLPPKALVQSRQREPWVLWTSSYRTT